MAQVVGPGTVVLLQALAGCAGLGGGGLDTTESTTTTTATTTTATTVAESAVVNYENLSADGKQMFTRLLDADSLTALAHEVPPALRPESGYEYVRYRGTLYELSREGVHIVRRALSVRSIIESQADNDAIHQYRNLSTDERTTFDAVRTAPNRTWYYSPENVSFTLGTHVIKYDGTQYELTVYHADFQGVRFSLQKVPTDR